MQSMSGGGPARRRELCDWFSRFPGQSLLAVEAHALRAVWPSLFGITAVQLGCLGPVDLLEDCNAPVRTLFDLPDMPGSAVSRICGLPEYLPFDQRSIDLMLLPHTLEFATDPHQVLREVSRVLSPEGHLVILGFNPFSFWGLRRVLTRRHRSAPWNGDFLHLARLKDWLKLLDFDPVQGRMLYYRPPLASEKTMERLRFLERAGDRWWPMTGAVYLMVAKKRVPGMMLLRPEWRKTPAFGRALARPALRVIRGG